MRPINFAQKLELFSERWSPKIIAEVNGQEIKLVRALGEFVWHHHEHEDEAFVVLRGWFRMEFRDHSELVKQGEMIIVPRGVEHRPVADEEVCLMLFEPRATLNTGTAGGDRTVMAEWI